jgi:hypothetical protein
VALERDGGSAGAAVAATCGATSVGKPVKGSHGDTEIRGVEDRQRSMLIAHGSIQ